MPLPQSFPELSHAPAPGGPMPLPIGLVASMRLRPGSETRGPLTADIELAPGVEASPETASRIDAWIQRCFAGEARPRVLALWPHGAERG